MRAAERRSRRLGGRSAAVNVLEESEIKMFLKDVEEAKKLLGI